MRESKIEQALVQRIKRLGGEIRKTQWLCRRGAPDRTVMLPGGRLVFVELKATGKKPEAHQAIKHEKLRRVGQEVLVIDSLESIEKHFPLI